MEQEYQMRLNKWLKEEGEVGGTVTADVAQFQPKLTLASRAPRKRVKLKKKSKLLG